MSRARIPVDLGNPGQVFACLGFIETSEKLVGRTVGGFDWQSSSEVFFYLETASDINPVERTLRFLSEAQITSIATSDSKNSTDKWGIKTIVNESKDYPFPDPISPATLPASLIDCSGNRLVINHWGDVTARRDNVKFWAGARGYPGAALTRDALALIRGKASDFLSDPFSFSGEQSSSFRFDWRRDYIPIDAGFSPNKHDGVVMQGYPIVELLAAIGLTNARPKRLNSKLEYSYGIAGIVDGQLYDPIFLRAALGSVEKPFPGLPFRKFTMKLGWPGQEGQARCITNVFEENCND